MNRYELESLIKDIENTLSINRDRLKNWESVNPYVFIEIEVNNFDIAFFDTLPGNVYEFIIKDLKEKIIRNEKELKLIKEDLEELNDIQNVN